VGSQPALWPRTGLSRVHRTIPCAPDILRREVRKLDSRVHRTVWPMVSQLQLYQRSTTTDLNGLLTWPDTTCWGKGEDATLCSRPSSTRCTNGGKMTGGAHPSSSSPQDEGRPTTESLHPTSSPDLEAHVGFRPL
jgi:hypothetical protein